MNKDLNPKSKQANDPNYTRNPKTGRWIKIGGKTYKDLVCQGIIDPSGPLKTATQPKKNTQNESIQF